jgi:hypothetical protein
MIIYDSRFGMMDKSGMIMFDHLLFFLVKYMLFQNANQTKHTYINDIESSD